jgi:hypothetical protein
MKLVALAIVATVLAGAGPTVHVTAREPAGQGPTTASATTRRLNDLAERLHLANVGAPRVAIFDAAWPADAAEYEALGHNGVLQVSAVVADAAELPVKRVYVRDENGEHELKWIGAMRIAVPPDAAAHGVGAFREDSYYVLPLALTDHHAMVLIDFAAHRKEFDLTPIPFGAPPPFAAADPGHIDPAALSAFVKREFKEAPPVSLGS